MTTNTTTAMVTFALLLGLMAGKFGVKARAQNAAQNVVVTYTLQQHEVITSNQGKVAHDWTRVLAQRRDGTTVRIDTIPGGHMKSIAFGPADVTVTATDINSSI